MPLLVCATKGDTGKISLNVAASCSGHNVPNTHACIYVFVVAVRFSTVHDSAYMHECVPHARCPKIRANTCASFELRAPPVHPKHPHCARDGQLLPHLAAATAREQAICCYLLTFRRVGLTYTHVCVHGALWAICPTSLLNQTRLIHVCWTAGGGETHAKAHTL